MLIRTLTLAISACLLALAAGHSQAAHSSYNVTIIGDYNTDANDLNNAGLVAGTQYDMSSFSYRAVSWSAGTGLQYLSEIPGAAGTGSFANGINNAGHIAGQSFTNSGNRASLWRSATTYNLGMMPGTTGTSNATSLNDVGQIAGIANVTSNIQHAVVWSSSGRMTDLGHLSGGTNASGATAINNSGQVVGWGTIDAQYTTHAFLWSAATGMQDLGDLYGWGSSAYSINNSGMVVGNNNIRYQDPKTNQTRLGSHAFVWSMATGMLDIGDLAGGWDKGYAQDVNNFGQVVGNGMVEAGPSPFIWDSQNGIADLNTLINPSDPLRGAIQLFDASAINDSGQIIARGQIQNGQGFHFLLTPVPEPETFAMLLSGLGLIATLKGRRKSV